MALLCAVPAVSPFLDYYKFHVPLSFSSQLNILFFLFGSCLVTHFLAYLLRYKTVYAISLAIWLFYCRVIHIAIKNMITLILSIVMLLEDSNYATLKIILHQTMSKIKDLLRVPYIKTCPCKQTLGKNISLSDLSLVFALLNVGIPSGLTLNY